MQRSVRNQSALCKVTCVGSSHGLKITVVKFYHTVVGTDEKKGVKKYTIIVVVIVVYVMQVWPIEHRKMGTIKSWIKTKHKLYENKNVSSTDHVGL